MAVARGGSTWRYSSQCAESDDMLLWPGCFRLDAMLEPALTMPLTPPTRAWQWARPEWARAVGSGRASVLQAQRGYESWAVKKGRSG